MSRQIQIVSRSKRQGFSELKNFDETPGCQHMKFLDRTRTIQLFQLKFRRFCDFRHVPMVLRAWSLWFSNASLRLRLSSEIQDQLSCYR